MSFTLNAQAVTEGSTINAEICDAQAPNVQVETPVSDSLTAVSTIALEGTAQRTSQIDIFVNNEYAASVAIGQDTQFSTTVSLKRGTNTIRLEAHNSCNQESQTVQIVVTYQPEALPAEGAGTNTQTAPPGSTVPETISSPADDSQPSRDTVFERIKDNLFGTDGDRSFVVPIRSWLALIIAVLSIVTVLAPMYLYMLYCRIVSKKPHPRVLQNHWIIRLIAAVLAALFVTIVQA